MTGLRIVFMGTAPLSCVSLRTLVDHPQFHLVAVVTQPDRPQGRELKLRPSPVKEMALNLALPVLQPEKARHEEFIRELGTFIPDLIVVVAYGQILPQSLLDLPRFGCLNVHTSLLPRYRGAAPIQWAILNDDPHTGVTIMKMDAGLDTGEILAQATTPIAADDTSQTLHDRLAIMGADLLVRTIPDYAAGRVPPHPQPAVGVTYAPKIRKQDGQIDWSQPARKIWSQVRGLVPWPGAFTSLPGPAQPHLLKIWQAQVVDQAGQPGVVLEARKTGIVVGCGTMALRIDSLQRESGRRLRPEQFLAGHPLKAGDRLG
jgi:methionyl-tRNA formyltransferase